MQYYGTATLIYIGQTVRENGSPVSVEITKDVKTKEIKAFSLYHYTTNSVNQRNMRKSKNLVVPRELTEDIIQDGITYELQQVRYNGLLYRVYNILAYFQSDLRLILDCEEIS